MQCVEVICVRSKKIKRIMQKIMHTHTEGDRDWLCSSAIAYFRGVEPRCKVFHYISIRLQLDLSETRLTLSHNLLLLTIP